MFDLDVDQRISTWVNHRNFLDNTDNSLQECWNFWKVAPFVPYNAKIDPYFQRGWPTPWEIIRDNKYDDFTKSLMISWTLKLTEKFKNSDIYIKFFIDNAQSRQYNLVFIDDNWILNYNDECPIHVSNLDQALIMQNLIEITRPR